LCYESPDVCGWDARPKCCMDARRASERGAAKVCANAAASSHRDGSYGRGSRSLAIEEGGAFRGTPPLL